MDFSDEIPGFLIESGENLSLLDSEMVELEKRPADEALISSVFRTIHTIKGTSGFFGFSLLGSVTHIAENILGQVREKQRTMTPALVSLMLRTVDAVRMILMSIECSGSEGADEYEPLRRDLNTAFHACTPLTSAAEAVSDDDLQLLLAAMECDRAATLSTHPREGHEPDRPAVPHPAHGSATSFAHPSTKPPHTRRAEDGPLAHSTVRVDVSLLDKLMNLVGELASHAIRFCREQRTPPVPTRRRSA